MVVTMPRVAGANANNQPAEVSPLLAPRQIFCKVESITSTQRVVAVYGERHVQLVFDSNLLGRKKHPCFACCASGRGRIFPDAFGR